MEPKITRKRKEEKMRIDFDNGHPSVRFKLEPQELEIELETGEKYPINTVEVNFCNRYIAYSSLAHIPNNWHIVEISSSCKLTIEMHAVQTIKERLGIGEFARDEWEIIWDNHYRSPNSECYFFMHLSPIA